MLNREKERPERLEIVEVYRAEFTLNDIPSLPNRVVTIYWDMDGVEIGRKDPAQGFKDILGLGE